MRPTWIAAFVIVVLAAGIAAYSIDRTGSTASSSGVSTPNNSSSLPGSSSTVFSNSSYFIQTTVQSSSVSTTSSLNQSAAQYPLVWAPNSPSGCYFDQFDFCVEALLGFSDNATTPQSNQTSSATTIIHGNATTIIRSSTTTIISGNSTTFVDPWGNASHQVAIWALVQNASTGQYITLGGGGSFVAGSCYLNQTGFTKCYAPGYLDSATPGPLSYKVTVFVTKG